MNSGAPSIYVISGSVTVLSENSIFWDHHDDYYWNLAVFVESGGSVDVPSSVLFYVDEVKCSTVFFQEDNTCL